MYLEPQRTTRSAYRRASRWWLRLSSFTFFPERDLEAVEREAKVAEEAMGAVVTGAEDQAALKEVEARAKAVV